LRLLHLAQKGCCQPLRALVKGSRTTDALLGNRARGLILPWLELAQDLVAHLGRHGLNARTQVIRRELATLAVSDTILTEVAELDADLLVMGAYNLSGP
jgi:hypothetical protein